ncbi:SDR family oxidoreductase [Nocardioides sp.]|uniref:SDR family oxidoreductase n=1 Tax=Nocardioides sp. TaxID=35761 RepID=UPI0039E470C1
MTPQGRFQGKVVLVTGANGGQGAVHVKRFLEEGANVVALDVAGMPEAPSVTDVGAGQLLECRADVRALADLERAVSAATEAFGGIDIVVANAGINGSRGPAVEFEEEEWLRVLDINLNGVWRTIKAAAPSLLASTKSPSVIIIGSTCAVKGYATSGHYTAAKHGLTGLLKVLSAELAPKGVRVNMINPTTVDTPLIQVQSMYDAFVPPGQEPTAENFRQAMFGLHQMPIPWIDPEDVTAAVMWLASEESRYVTGAQLSVDGGAVLL